ncbi:MAG: FAD-binding oxidoreductase [Gammaproteobacteria bacterium]|nr:FAD-binding oxidoreductase [Gammaproteobacteria bacterium]
MALDLLYANDRQGEYPDSYYAATAIQLPLQPRLEQDIAVDVCIIGAGYCGLSSALHLAKRGYSVALLDAHRVGWGASGRNGGQLGSGQRADQWTLEKRDGMAVAKQLWDIAEESKALVKSLIAEHNINCDLLPGIAHTDHKPQFVEESRAYNRHLAKHYGYDQIQELSSDERRHYINSPAYYGGSIDWGAAHLHPLNFALGLGQACLDAGVKIYENSAVTAVEQRTVRTVYGQVCAKTVIYAANGYLGQLHPKIASRVMPINNFILTSTVMDEVELDDILAKPIAVADSKFVVNYFRRTIDNRLLFGGGENYGYRFPSNIGEFVKKHMLPIFPQLKSLEIEYAWGGTLGITVNRMPYFAQLDANTFTAAGFSGHGLGMATMAGAILAAAVDGEKERFDLQSQIPTYPFPGGSYMRWPLLVAAMLFYKWRDRL